MKDKKTDNVKSCNKQQTNDVAIIPQAKYTDRERSRRLSAKLVPAFAGRGMSRGQRNGSPRPLRSGQNCDIYIHIPSLQTYRCYGLCHDINYHYL
jgi:hypothetical protein